MTATTETDMLPVDFVPPLRNPAPGGLYPAVSWTETTEAPRWLASGVQLRGSVIGNYSGDLSTGIWNADWCASPDDLTTDDYKDGTRPGDLDPFDAVTVWGFDSCDLTAPSQAEVRQRAQQVLRLREPVMVAREFAGRIKTDAGTPTPAADLVAAIGELEAAFADDNAVGLVHASPKLLPALTNALLVQRSASGGWRTPAGHTLIVDGGFRAVLGDDTLIGTSALFGWRNPVEVRTTVKASENLFIALAERSVVVGYEQAFGAVQIGGSL